MLSEIIIILLLIIVNGIFSMSEIALFSSRKSKLESMAKRGDRNAKVALRLLSGPTEFLSTVQIGITLTAILTGMFSGVDIAVTLEVFLANTGYFGSYAHIIALLAVVITISFLTLVVGELVPKKIALSAPESFAKFWARPMSFISTVAAPVVWLLSNTTDLIIRLLNLKPSEENSVTEEEIKSLINQGKNTGEVEETEKEIIDRVFHLGDRKVGSFMTNRMDMVWLDVNDPFEVNRQKMMKSSYSNFPLCTDAVDNLTGIVNIKKVLNALHTNEAIDLVAITEEPLFIPENMTTFKVLDTFKEHKKRIAIVVDEYGGVQGIVTMHDITEALLGDIEQPADPEDEVIVQRQDGSYFVDGLISFEEFLQYFEMEDVSIEDRGGFHTLGGFILHLNEQIPKAGDVFEWSGFKFEIADLDGNRIDKIIVSFEKDPKDTSVD